MCCHVSPSLRAGNRRRLWVRVQGQNESRGRTGVRVESLYLGWSALLRWSVTGSHHAENILAIDRLCRSSNQNVWVTVIVQCTMVKCPLALCTRPLWIRIHFGLINGNMTQSTVSGAKWPQMLTLGHEAKK